MIPILMEKVDKEAFFKRLEIRGNLDTGEYAIRTKAIVEAVRTQGDEALFNYTTQWDHPDITKENVKVSMAEMKEAFDTLPEALKKALIASCERITAFHEKQKQNTWIDIKPNGELLGQRDRKSVV